MKQFLSFVLFVIFALSINASAGEVNLRINGVGLGTKEATVLRKLGKPLQARGRGFDECGGGFQKTLRYSGLVVELLSDGKRRNYTVVSVKLTSSKRLVASKISIGTDVKVVQTKFGQPNGIEQRNGRKVLFYVNKGNDGFANFFFRGNKLVEIRWSSALC